MTALTAILIAHGNWGWEDIAARAALTNPSPEERSARPAGPAHPEVSRESLHRDGLVAAVVPGIRNESSLPDLAVDLQMPTVVTTHAQEGRSDSICPVGPKVGSPQRGRERFRK